MRQNNVAKHLKNAHAILEATGKERAPQLKTSVNPATASTKKYEEFCLFEQFVFTRVCVAHVYKNLWFCLIYFC
jgi:hypothetical protein